MAKFKIGAMVESFRLDTFEAIEKASTLGVDGLQMYCSNGENAPENMTNKRKNRLIKTMKDNGLVFSAICGDMGHGFGNKEANPKYVEKSKRIIDLAKELGTNIVTTHIGVVPKDKNHDRYKVMQEAIYDMATYAESVGSTFAVETGPEPSAVLAEFIRSIGSKGIGVNLDPANLAMVIGEKSTDAVANLKDFIVHTHAKDGIKLLDMEPEYIYGIWEKPETLLNKCAFKEVPLGDGSVDFPKYLKALENIGYNGYLTIERECGQNPIADIEKAVKFLKGLI